MSDRRMSNALINSPASGLPGRHVKLVDSFEALVVGRFEGEVNALCWSRQLSGDFGEIARHFQSDDGIVPVEEDTLRELDLSAEGARARDVLLADLTILRECGLAPSIDCITAYPRDDEDATIATDVYSFHADRAPVEADTWLCTYFGAPSEALPNEMAARKVEIPETRAALLKEYGRADDADFAAWLSENCYDLHYAPLRSWAPYSFGVGNLWRVAIEHPHARVQPCIHRAPPTLPVPAARLLLIS